MAADADTRFTVTYHRSPHAGRLALMTMDNGQDHTRPTTFGESALDSLEAALNELEGQTDVKGLLLTGKPFVFAAGADLDAFDGATAEFAERAARAGHDAFARLRGLPYPSVAAINGVALGGGLEIALHCDYRTVSTGARALGFPEVFLSILPGWGGTQLTPALIGPQAALRAIVHNALDQNRTLKPTDAIELGLADRLLEPVDFLERSVAFLEGLAAGEIAVDRHPPEPDQLDAALEAARQAADAKTHGATPAPYRAIELVEFAARGGDLAQGREREIAALTELLPSRQAQASVYGFNLTQQRVRRQPGRPDAAPREVTKVGVLGAGLMGRQLAALLLHRHEVPMVITDVDQNVLEAAQAHIEGELDQRVQRGRLDADKAGWLASVTTYARDAEALQGADFVIEAVGESLKLKQRVFADAEKVVDEGCVLASNTSSLSVAAMAADLDHPERVVGLHFFNPVALMPLVEVVRPGRASDEAVATAFELAKTLRKSAVGCADTPGFIVNRLLMRFMGAAAQAADSGTRFADVDAAIKALGLPMGPFELMGLVGLAVNAHVARSLHEAYPDRFPLNPNVAMLGELDLPGGYDWDAGGEPFAAISERWQVEPDAQPLAPEAIRQRALAAAADEIAHMLADATVADARDIDTGLLLGAGFPFFTGGLCCYLDQTGLSQQLLGRRLVTDTDQALAPAP